jgi:hypothetical protein
MNNQTENETTPEEAKERLRQMILYVAQICSDEHNFGATHLNKILWNADKAYYESTGRSITKAKYIKLQYGPVPMDMKDLKRSMIAAHEIAEVPGGIADYPQKRIIPLVEADLADFTGEEISLVTRVATNLCKHSATHVSDMTHGRAWKAAEFYEVIPDYTAFISDEKVTASDEWFTMVMARKHGWESAETVSK